ncbi:MAG TPA: response regulator [Roseiflexaceae bacterium]|jgi:DNA-binding response OmpR family regulator|nr:response regulator [Roseiflexaceae bacterium]
MNAGCDILLIEDSASQALRVQLLLQRAGYQVDVATDGEAGWHAAYTHSPRLILLDIDLPKLNGFQVLSRLKRGQQTRHIPVVMLTNREHVSHVLQSLELGADDYLPKPDMPTHIQTVVEQFLEPSDS